MKMLSHILGQTDQPTGQQSDQLLELLEWLFATKNILLEIQKHFYPQLEDFQHSYFGNIYQDESSISHNGSVIP